jgi:hypothetical protein
VTVTVHGRGAESRAWKRIVPPRTPLTAGEYSFGSPVAATRCRTDGRSAYMRVPGQAVGPVSR